MSVYIIIILAVFIFEYFLETTADVLNLKNLSLDLPEEFQNIYNSQEYKKSQDYLRDTTKFNLFRNTFSLAVVLGFILLGGVEKVYIFAESFGFNTIISGLLFFGVVFLGLEMLSIPFSWYKTFVIEQKYGFNRASLKTFSLDIIKSFFLTIFLGGLVLAFVFWCFLILGKLAWIFCWLGVFLFEVFVAFIAPVWIMPLFNKFTPLEEGPLKNKIEDYFKKQAFSLKGIFKIDGSRRSAKTNAFFTGFGRSKRVALFDTLLEKHPPEEIVAILAHEAGHYRHKHLIKGLAISFFSSGLMFFLLNFFIYNPRLSSAFGIQPPKVYTGLFLFTLLFRPINLFISILINCLYRKYEYQADEFAVKTTGSARVFVSALKRLAVSNLSNLTPHPFKVFIHYDHPPLRERIRNCLNLADS